MSQGVLQNLRSKLFAHLQKLPMSFYDKTEVGRLMSRMHGDVGQLQEVGALIVATLGELLSLIGIIVFLMIMSFKLAIITLIVVPVLFILLIVWQKLAKRLYIENRISHSITINNLAETINGSKIIQILTRQKTNMNSFDTKNSHLLKTSKSATYVSSGVLPGVDFLTSIAISLVIFFGSKTSISLLNLTSGVLISVRFPFPEILTEKIADSLILIESLFNSVFNLKSPIAPEKLSGIPNSGRSNTLIDK